MAIESDLKIFISWSGDLSREVTKVLREWLPKMFDHIDPWASEVDIEAGERGLSEIENRLKDSGFGIIVVTTDNMDKPWLNFEAGALSKSLGGDTPRVVPLLVNLDSVYQIQGPISQFQAVKKLDREGVSRLCRSIASAIGLDPATINSRFEWAWPDLMSAVEEAKGRVGEQPPAPNIDDKDILRVMAQELRDIGRKVNGLVTSGDVVVSSKAAVARSIGSRFSNIDDGWVSSDAASRKSRLRAFESEAALRAALEEVESIAAGFKPVRWVRLMNNDNGRFIGINFKDNQPLSAEDTNWLLEQTMKLNVPVAVITTTEAF